MLQMKIDLTVESESEAERMVGPHDTDAGSVTVDMLCGDGSTGIIEVAIKGTAPAIIAWMTEEWQDDELAMDEFEEALEHGKITVIREP